MLVAAAVCPFPPVLLPEVAAGAAPELDELRDAGERALTRMLAARPDPVVVLGPGTVDAVFGSGSAGSLAPYGVAVRVALGPAVPGADARQDLPPPLTVGAWWLSRAGWKGPATARALPASLPAEDCAAIGHELAASHQRLGLLVCGDASARRSRQAPGYVDDRARGFDTDVAAALGSGDVDALAKLDLGLATELLALGRPAWQVLAGASRDVLPGPGLATELLYDQAPYGVGYLVASWVRSDSAH